MFDFQDFQLPILVDCLRLGLRLTMATIQRRRQHDVTLPLMHPPSVTSPLAQPPADDTDADSLHDMYKASQVALLRHINSVTMTLPLPHQMLSFQLLNNRLEEEYQERMFQLFAPPTWASTLFPLAEVLLEYMTSLGVLPWQASVPPESVRDVVRFGVVCLEVSGLLSALPVTVMFILYVPCRFISVPKRFFEPLFV